MNEHHIHAWKLSTTSLGCMSCPYVAQAVVNVWVAKREWLVVFLCTACLFRAKRDANIFKGFLGEKRVHEREMVEINMTRQRKRGDVA